MRSAIDIATDIEAVVDSFLDHSITYPECSAQTKALWDEARQLGLVLAVDEILHEREKAAWDGVQCFLPCGMIYL